MPGCGPRARMDVASAGQYRQHFWKKANSADLKIAEFNKKLHQGTKKTIYEGYRGMYRKGKRGGI